MYFTQGLIIFKKEDKHVHTFLELLCVCSVPEVQHPTINHNTSVVRYLLVRVH